MFDLIVTTKYYSLYNVLNYSIKNLKINSSLYCVHMPSYVRCRHPNKIPILKFSELVNISYVHENSHN